MQIASEIASEITLKTDKRSNEELESNFLNSCKSPATRQLYSGNVRVYMKAKEVKSYSALVNQAASDTQAQIISFIIGEKKKGRSAVTLNGYVNALKHFFEMNDIDTVNWRKIRRFVGEYKRSVDDVPYTTAQIKHLLTFCDIRERILVLLMSSSGIRVGAIQPLNIGDFTPVHDDKLYQITVYRGTKQQYVTFCSSECKQALDEYLDMRKRYGEKITNESALITHMINQDIPDNAKDCGRVSDSEIRAMIFRLLVKSGMRVVKGGDFKVRKGIMATHGFRKFFKSTSRRAGVDALILELFMGHLSGGGVVSKLQMVYEGHQHDQKELLEQYLKAHNDLTINSQHRLEMELKAANEKLHDLNAVKVELRKEIKAEIEKDIDSGKYWKDWIEKILVANGDKPSK